MQLRIIAGDAANASRHILFLHGLSGHMEKTWTGGQPDNPELWPHWLAEDFPGTAVWLVGYPAPWTHWFNYGSTLSEVADNLLARLQAEDRLCRGTMVFAGHSYGGLVIKQLFRAADRDSSRHDRARSLLARSKEVVFFGTPHRGAVLANIADAVRFPLRPSHPTQELRIGNGHVQDLYSWYKSFSRDEGLRHLPLSEGKPVTVLGVSVPAFLGKIVSFISADPGVAELPVSLIDENHISMCKPRSRDSDAYVFLRHFLRGHPPEPLPPGFESPDWLAGDTGLRARLRPDRQAYVPATDGPTIEALLQRLEDYEHPLVITGDGGLGKTRLALELWRASGHRGVLIQRDATAEGVRALIQKAKDENKTILFLIDYMEELSGQYDAIHQTVIRESGGFAFLITTSRTISVDGLAKTGPRYLNARACQDISLNDDSLKPWREHVCAQILQAGGVPESLRHELAGLDVPVIASLAAYDFEKHGVTDATGIGRDDGAWLTRRLRQHIGDSLEPEDFITLLCLYPFGTDLRDALPKELRAASDNLQRQGWVSQTPSGEGTEWRLGHDLLSDIPLVMFLLAEQRPALRYERIARLGQRANALGGTNRFARSLSRALRRLIGGTEACDILDTFQACITPLSSANPDPDLARQVGEKALYSLSLPLYQKIGIFQNLSNLFYYQLIGLIDIFTDELNEFKNLFREEYNLIIELINFSTFGCQCHADKVLRLIQKGSEASHHYLERTPIKLRGSLIPGFGNGLSDMLKVESVAALPKHEGEWISQAMFMFAEHIAGRDNDPSAYDTVIQRFADDQHPQVREEAAKAAFNKAHRIAEHDNDPSAYDTVIQRFADDQHPQAREQAAKAAFNKAHRIAKRDNDPSAYDTVIQRFADDQHPQVREEAARAAFNKAHRIAEHDNDPSAYDTVIQRFADDQHPQAREQAATAAFNKAYDIAERDNDPSAYDTVIQRFADDQHPQAREWAAKAAFNKAYDIAERDNDPSAYDTVNERFADDQHPEIRELVQLAREARMGWLVVAGRFDDALEESDILLTSPETNPGRLAAVAFLTWLAAPTPEHKERADDLAAALNGEPTTWTFDEFAQRIADLGPDDRAFAAAMIRRLERPRS
ncbi:hypothetical protein M2352_002112 [Azospirillum fermentarium]|uniref:HEAT repeat domain-containing protein n=1 Tax=Azospirillum fermentarium TaxID=1233114 RepID=UPI002225BFB6|nr:HEAT repeat domain-containing protein [Azospirillum fermentarium]MCW2246521.1 hypothetical protein [Azospirillum fermentarium]